VNVFDAVGGEERSGTVHERDRGGSSLVSESFGVGEAGELVDRRVQVHVSGAGARGLCPVDRLGAVAAAAVGTPTAAVGDVAGLLDVDVDQVAGPAGDDPSWFAVGLTGWIEEPAPVQPEVGQVPADRPHRDGDAVVGEFEGDAPGRPFLLAAQVLDPGDDLCCGDVGDRTSLASLDEPSVAFYGQRGVGVRHRRYSTRFRSVAGERRSTIAKSSDHCPGERSRGSGVPRNRWPASHFSTAAFAGPSATRGKI
jgi:hypothetical protein